MDLEELEYWLTMAKDERWSIGGFEGNGYACRRPIDPSVGELSGDFLTTEVHAQLIVGMREHIKQLLADSKKKQEYEYSLTTLRVLLTNPEPEFGLKQALDFVNKALVKKP